MCRGAEEMQRGVEVRCTRGDAEMKRCRGVDVQRCRDAPEVH